MTRRSMAAFALQAPAPAVPRKIGLIGNGNRATAHLAAYLKMPEAQVNALCDLDASRMDAFNTKLGNRAVKYADWRELIRDRNVDVVAITTPNYLHAEMAIAALRAGKHVVLEKPIAISYQQARQIQAEARRSGKTLAIGMQRRFWKRDAHVQRLVDEGVIGTPHLIHIAEYRGDWSPRGWHYADAETGKTMNWRFSKKATGSTELEFGVHAFSQVVQLVKSPLVRCVASGGTVHYRDHETRDVCEGLLEFASGVRLNYSFCLFAAGVPGTTVIAGGKGAIRYNETGEILLDLPGKRGQKPPELTGFPDELAEVQLYREFFAAIDARREPAVNAELAIEAAKIAWAMDLAITAKRAVTDADFS